MMKLRFASPDLLVDLNDVPGLDYHRADPDGTLHIGALCRHADLEWSGLLRSAQPTMAAAAPLIADPLVRNRGRSWGRCATAPAGRLGRGDARPRRLGGCAGPAGRRSIPLADFVTGPFENTLAHDEIAVEAVVPPRAGPRRRLLKLERRVGDFATVGVAVADGDSGPDRPRRSRADRRRRLDDRRHRRLPL